MWKQWQCSYVVNIEKQPTNNKLENTINVGKQMLRHSCSHCLYIAPANDTQLLATPLSFSLKC